MRAVTLTVLAGCFNPSLQSGLPCSSSGWCPPPQRCEPSTNICEGTASDVDAGAPDANYVFVTSTRMPFTLATTAMGDIECKAAALRGGLRGTYVAWMSTAVEDAKARIPASARGWLRPDGLPFGDTLDDILGGEIFYPPTLDEYGAEQIALNVGTGTLEDGTHSPDTCSGTPYITIGVNDGAKPHWTDTQSQVKLPCSNSLPIYCFGIDRSVEVKPSKPTQGRLAFVTANTYPAMFGVNALDGACADEGQTVGLPGEYVAIAAIAGASAKTRSGLTVDPQRPWMRLDGVVVTDNLLTLRAPISMTAGGAYVSQVVMTGAPSLDGIPGSPADNCQEWMDPSSTLSAGISSRSASDGLSGYRTEVCDQRVYCLQK